MKIKSAKSFRFWYKTKIKEIEKTDQTHNENFVGTYHKENGKKTIKGFFEMYHGDKPDIASYLPSILKIAEDGQAIYEFLQNAVDCGSTHFYIFYNDKYFLAINNGSPFDVEGLQSILNIAQTTKKDPDKIGRFGIGFKLAHRLVGKNEGTDELVRQYKGPILFSWAKLKDLESLLNNEQIEPLVPNKENYQEFINSPYLLKLLLTNFPSDPNERVKDINYQDKILFPQSELKELIDFLNENFQQHSDSLKKNVLKQGSLFFIKLGEDKKKLLDKDYSELVNGIQYSMNTLKRLQKVYINNDDIGKIPLQLEEGAIKKGSDVFEQISPEYKEFDIKFAIGFKTIKFGNEKSYEQIKLLKEKPNFYKYFPMGDEINGLGFIVHCDSFSNEANRRKLHEDDVNRNLFPELAKFVTQRLDEYKANDRNKFLNLYASLLLSDVPERQNNKWLKSVFYDVLHNYIKTNLPTKTDISDNPQNVKINKLKQQLNLSDFGLNNIKWFEWDNEADDILINEAKNKVGIESWDIRDIVENANIESVNNWIEQNCNNETYKTFLKDLEESSLRIKTKERICQIKLFKFSNDKFYSLNEIISLKDKFGKTSFKFTNCFFSNNKTKKIKNELIKLGLVVSELPVEDYHHIFSSIILPDDKKHYDLIAKWCVENANKLTSEEKKNLFLNFINETTKFDNVAEGTLKDLCLFSDSNSEIKPLNKLVDFNFNTPNWLNTYKIKSDEFFAELKPFLISETETLFQHIYLPKQDIILSELTEAKEIKSLIKLYQDNQRQFFKEFIIKKTENSFSIAKKTSNTYQVQSADPEVRKFIDTNCANNLFVLPEKFLDFKEEDGIIKAFDLHSKILDFVNIEEHKETIIDIIRYDEPKRKFLQKLSEFRFNPKTIYTKDNYEYKILDLACSELKENDYQTFRNKFVIETETRNFKLSEIPPFTDKVKIANKEFSLSKILPATHQNSNLVGDLISLFTKQGVSNEKLNALFGVDEELDIEDIFEKYTEQTEVFENTEQFFFLIFYNKHIKKIDLSKLGFDLNYAVFPSEFALEKEKLPEYLQNWITKKEIDLSELDEIGVFTENSTLVSLREFFLSKTDFNVNTIAEKLSSNEIMLLNTFELLKEKGIELSNKNEFSVFKEIVRVINSSRANGQELKIQDKHAFDVLEEKSTEWKSVNNFSIYLYQGALPKIVKLDKNQDYVFYQYNDTDFAVNGNAIFINENTDSKKTLQKVASDDSNKFSFEELWSLFEDNNKDKNKEKQEANSTFLVEVNEFISELEGTEWNDFVPELKNILELSVSHPKEKQKLFNLIAKIKLAKELDIHFEVANKDYNHLENGNEKYFVHSARGAFAYIHPNEILKMKDAGYKMALDFNTKSRIKIYETAEEILQLNTNHILAYQYEKTMEELFSFCQANKDANKHLLIIDKNNSGEKSRALLKLLNIEDDYQ
ncbi:ATP-binding protein [Kaistella daneshvariae]|uniref:ATP-binding protein n=1 Tax=Kaistella daneshvariae TaxID=2487074 RepID=A0ABM7C5C6_9FLAO|nr:ATP-binding protein [Kaistella daneshvariae]AZI66159.1 ATP-binding protein [Kaistella daneshvariae]